MDKRTVPEPIQICIDTIDAILDSKDGEDIVSKLNGKIETPFFVFSAIQHCLKIRPNQTQKFIDALTILSKDYNINDIDNEIIRRKIKSQMTSESTEDLTFFISDKKLENILKEDNVEQFRKYIYDNTLNNTILGCSSLSYVKNVRFSYLDISAFYGAVNCLKEALNSKMFSLEGLNKFAIAGGNREIIQILAERGVNFDGCFDIAVRYHRYEIADWLLENFKCEQITLIDALECYNFRLFNFLLRNEIDNSQDSLNHSLIFAIKRCNLTFIKYLIEECHVETNSLHLHTACNNNRVDVARYLVEKDGVNIEEKDRFGKTLLYDASNKCKLDSIKYLIEELHADIKTISENSLSNACAKGDVELVRYLVQNFKMNPWELDENRNIPYQIAIKNDQLDVVKWLVEEFDKKGYLILHYACSCGNLRIVKYLLEEKDLDVNEMDTNKDTPLSIAIREKKNNIIIYLATKFHLDISSASENLFLWAIFKNDIAFFIKLTKELHLDANIKYKSKNTPLIYACRRKIICKDNLNINDISIIRYMVEECKVNLEEKDNNGKTALHNACIYNDFPIINYLVSECHVNINAKDEEEKTVLHMACEKENLEMVKYLVNVGKADINIKRNNGITPLHIAAENNNIGIIKFLVEDCHALLQRSKKDLTPVHIACMQNNFTLVKYLLEKCPKLEYYPNGKPLLLNISCQKENIAMVKYLVEQRHVDVNQKDEKGRSAIFFAASHGNLEIFKYLFEECHAEIELSDRYCLLPIEYIFSCNRCNIIRYLLEKFHSNTEFIKKYANSAMIIAHVNNETEMEQYIHREFNIDLITKY